MKIGIFGGTFNPVHIGHIELARRVADSFKLDKFIFVPSKVPPHKAKGIVSAVHRYKMVEIAISSLDSRFSVSDFEIKSKEISYTYNTLKYFRKMYPDDLIYFIVGTDIFSTIETWHKWKKLFELTNFIVVSRNGVDFKSMLDEIPTELYARVSKDEPVCGEVGSIIFFHMEPINVSSTDIRQNCNKNELLDDVYKYIKENNLYEIGE